VNRQFFLLWVSADGARRWSGPHEDIDTGRAGVPGDAQASVIVVPLQAMTPGEKREALPILERTDAENEEDEENE
jgi:hypothetical protein